MNKITNIFTLSSMLLIFIVAWIIESHFLLNGDSSWYLLIAKRLLAGGSYTKDFFEVGHPLIIYLHIPPNYLASWLSINSVLAFRIYVFGLAGASLVLNYLLLRPIFLKEHASLAYLFFAMIATVLFILPCKEFGQREHLLLIFTLPYFLAIVYRLHGRAMNPWSAIGIGLFAAIGFAIKPHYVIAFILVEAYVLFYTRKIRSVLRPDSLTIVIMFLIYLLFVFTFHSDYIYTVVPMAVRYYYASVQQSWIATLTFLPIFFLYLAIIFYITQYKKNPYKILSTVLLLATLGFMCAYLLQKTTWVYHALPFFSMALLMTTLLFGIFIIKQTKNIPLIALMAGLLFSIPWYFIEQSWMARIKLNKLQREFTTVLHTYAFHKTVSYIGAQSIPIFPSVNDAGSIYTSRFLHFFWMPGIIKKSTLRFKHLHSQQEINDELFFINMISEDIEMKKPKFIFVDANEHKAFYSLIRFEYLPYLLKNTHFQAAWKPYHYVTTIEEKLPLDDYRNWDLYLMRDKKEIRPQTINGNAVILIGTGTNRRAYYVLQHAVFKVNNSLLYYQVPLTEQESSQLRTQVNKVKKTENNQKLINLILNRALNKPSYAFHIYQREDNNVNRGLQPDQILNQKL